MIVAYLASGFGFSEATSEYLQKVVGRLKSLGIVVFTPWDNTYPGASREFIAASNIGMIRQADILIANLDGQEVDSGVAWEMGFAAGLGKAVYAWRADIRASGEAGGVVNLQVEYGAIPPVEGLWMPW